jgi:hypothetical protein
VEEEAFDSASTATVKLCLAPIERYGIGKRGRLGDIHLIAETEEHDFVASL